MDNETIKMYGMLAVAGLVMVLCFVMWMMFKKVKKLETSVRGFQKTNNELTNVKFMIDDITSQMNSLKTTPVEHIPVQKKPEPVKEAPKTVKFESLSKGIEVESVGSVEGEDDIEVLEEDDDE